MTQVISALLYSLIVINSVAAIDYNFMPSDELALPCPGKEDKFFDKYFDYSNLETKLMDDETVILDGFVTFTRELDPDEPIFFRLTVYKLKGGQWISTGQGMNRNNICQSFFEPNEIWYDQVKELPTVCPPKEGTKYEFRNKTMTASVQHFPVGQEGFYRLEATLSNSQNELCAIFPGEMIRQSATLMYK